jgi:hypothetical protein
MQYRNWATSSACAPRGVEGMEVWARSSWARGQWAKVRAAPAQGRRVQRWPAGTLCPRRPPRRPRGPQSAPVPPSALAGASAVAPLACSGKVKCESSSGSSCSSSLDRCFFSVVWISSTLQMSSLQHRRRWASGMRRGWGGAPGVARAGARPRRTGRDMRACATRCCPRCCPPGSPDGLRARQPVLRRGRAHQLGQLLEQQLLRRAHGGGGVAFCPHEPPRPARANTRPARPPPPGAQRCMPASRS